MTTIAPDLSAVLDRILDSVTVQNASGQLIYANAVAARQMGFATTEEFLSADPASWTNRYTVYDEHGAPLPWDQLPGRRILAGLDAPDILLRYRDEVTGGEGWAEAHASPLTSADGTRLAVNVVRDVTDRVKAETALREREARLQAVLTAIPDLMFVQAADGTFLDFHAEDDSRLFVPPAEFLGKKLTDILPPEVAAAIMPSLEHTARTGEPTAVEYALPIAGGKRHSEARIVRLDEGRVLSIVRDLTDRVRIEEALKERRRFADLVAAASPAILYVYDWVQNRTIYTNQAVTRLLGYSPGTIEGMSEPLFTALLHPEDQVRLPEMAAQLLAAADGEIVEHSYRLRHATGQWCWLASRVTVMTRTPDGAPHLVVGAALDVTAQRETEDALRASEARYRAVVEGQTELVDRYLPDTTLTFVNDAYCRYFGRTREELIGERFQEWLPPSARYFASEVIARIMASAEPVTSELEAVRPDGSIGYVQWVDRAIRNANGEVIELQGVGRDVTDRVRAEEALAESRRLADRVGAASPDILYVFDVLDARTVYVNDAIGRVLGYSAEQLTAAEAAEPMAMRHPDDLVTFHEAMAQVGAADDGEVIEFAFRMRHADGGWRWLAARVTVLSREADGRPRLVVGAALDVTELRETEAALRASEARYRNVVELQSELVSRYLPDTTLTFVNDAYCRYFDRTREELVGTSFLTWLPPLDHTYMLGVIAAILASDEPVTYEHPVILTDGSVRHLQWVDRAIRNANGDVVELQGVGRDVTAQREAEDALRASEARYRAVVESQTELVARYLPDSTLTFVNDAYCRYFGRSKKELIGSRFFEHDPPWTHEETLLRLAEAITRVEPTTVEGEEYLRDGSIGWVQWINRAIRDSNGEVIELQGVGRDVTELRRAEGALRESEARYRGVVESQTEMICRYLPDTTLTFVNDAYCRYFGQTRDELIGVAFLKWLPPSAHAYALSAIESVVTSPQPITSEHEVVRPDGTIGHLQWVDHAIRDANGNVVELQGVGRDITELRRTEDALRASEARYRAVVESQTEMICRYLPGSTIITFVNDANCRAAGRPREELLGLSLIDLVPPSDRARMAAYFASLAADPRTAEIEHQVDRPDGSIGWEHWVDTPIFDADGEVVEFQSVGRDVTELRRAEDALRASEARYRDVVDLQTELVARFLPDTTLTFVNDAYARVFGRTKEELIGTRFLELDPPSTRETTLAYVAAIGTSTESATVEHEVYLPDGGHGWVQWNNRPIRDANGKVIEVQAVGRDVTELRRAEEALRASETKLLLALENARMGTWDWNVDTGWVAWSDSSGPLYGLPAGTPGITMEAFYTRVHPGDRARVQAEVNQRVADAADYAVEFRVVWPNGATRWLERRGKAVARDVDGRAIRLLGVTLDITERKHSEAALRRLSHQLLKLQDDERRRLARELHDGVAQDIFGITVALASIEQAASRLNDRAQEALAEAQILAEQALQALRTQAYLLHPPALDMAGLAPALREYASGLARRGEFKVDTSGVENVGRLPAEVETALFRVAQEALTNVSKHAATDRATLTLRFAEGMVELQVADQGTGRMSDGASYGPISLGVGIPGMRERLRQIGGELEIATGPGWTTVTARTSVGSGVS